jgi:hypothetical protein
MDRAGRAWGVVASWDLGPGARAGVFKDVNGDVYDGEYKDNKKNGKGAWGGCRGLMVKASGWPSFDRQFEPYPRAL